MRPWLAAFGILLLADAARAADDTTRFWFEALNLLLLLGVLLWFARRHFVNAYLAARREQIQQSIASSEQLLAEAEARLAEWQARADGLEAEVEEIKQSTRRAAEKQREAILHEAALGAERSRAETEAVTQREWFRAREALRREIADEVITRAGELLREQTSRADRARLADEFIARLEAGETGAAETRV